MPEIYTKLENNKNGIILGAVLGAVLLWGQYIKDPILNFLNGIIPVNYQLGGFTAMAIIILIGAIIGYAVDKF